MTRFLIFISLISFKISRGGIRVRGRSRPFEREELTPTF
tara:strand:- start:69 stop:185 length:117 start_codon:yes stop_codon:yes gene_type:complete